MKKRMRTSMLVMCGVFGALIAICSQIQIPLPMVPINLALFAVHLCGALLGPVYGGIALIIYVLTGLMGLPVFVGFNSGVSALFGRTGGYIWGYILDAVIVGYIVQKWGTAFKKCCLAMTLGLIACYIFGTLWFMYLTGVALWGALMACVLPFLAGDAVKIALAAMLTGRLKKILRW